MLGHIGLVGTRSYEGISGKLVTIMECTQAINNISLNAIVDPKCGKVGPFDEVFLLWDTLSNEKPMSSICLLDKLGAGCLGPNLDPSPIHEEPQLIE